MRHQAVPLFVAATILFAVCGARASAQTVPPPSPVPSAPAPAPAASASPAAPKAGRFSLKIDTYTSGTNQQFVGPGTLPAEGPAFRAGSQVAPETPYDFFSGGAQATGEGITQEFLLKPTFAVNRNVDVSVTFGYGSATGTGNVINYWGDSIMAPINPNLGRRAFTIAPAFTTHNGQDPVSATDVGVLQGSIMDHNGNGGVTIGWFNLHQSAPFALTQAPWTTTPFEVVPQLAGSIGDGPPAIDVLRGSGDILPLSGVDGWYKNDLITYEFTSALLPAPTNSPARLMSGSLILDNGSGVKYSGQLSELEQYGPSTGRVLFGTAPSIVDGIPQSTLFGQHQLVAGVSAAFPIGLSDVELRYGYSCYNAIGTAASTASCTSGNYLYGKLHHGFAHFDVAVEGVRFDASYAPAVLDYGTIQNIWTYAAALPSNTLRGTYQLVDTSAVGPNRIGLRVSGTTIVAGLEVRLAYAQDTQLAAFDASTAFTSGYIEPYFLPQLAGNSTLGSEQHFEGWFSYHAKFADIVLDLAQVNTWRQGSVSAPGDNVKMSYPSAMFSLTRPFGTRVTASAGVGRSALNGQFDSSGPNNAQLTEDVVFAGLQYRSNATSGYGLEWRLYSVSGIPLLPGDLSPAYHGPQIQFYQRFKT